MYERLLVAVDGSSASLHALRQAFRITRGPITVLAVAPPNEGDLRLVGVKNRESLLTAWDSAMHGEPYDIEHRILIDDEVRWVHERAELSFADDGRPLFAVGTAQAGTDLRQARQQNVW